MVDEAKTETTETEVEMVPKTAFLARVAEEKSKRDELQARYTELESKSRGWQELASAAETATAKVAELQAQLEAREAAHQATTTMLRAGVDDEDMHEFMMSKHSRQDPEDATDFQTWFEAQKDKPFLAPFLRGATKAETTTETTTETTKETETDPTTEGKNGVQVKADITGRGAAAPKTGGITTESLGTLRKDEWEAVRREEIRKAFQR